MPQAPITPTKPNPQFPFLHNALHLDFSRKTVSIFVNLIIWEHVDKDVSRQR